MTKPRPSSDEGTTTAPSQARGPSIEARIHQHYAALPESERKLADVILERSADLSAFKASELSALAGVSKAAATRLFQRLGFESFDAARRAARARRDWGSPLYMGSTAGGAALSGPATLLEDEIALLRRSVQRLSPAMIDDVAAAMVAARRVWLLGYRNSRFLAEYLRWQVLQFRGDVHLLAGSGETVGEHVADFTGQDVLVVIALRRRVKGLLEMMQAARAAGVPIILITDPTARRLPALADWTLTVETQGRFTFDSCGPALALCRFLAVTALGKAGRRGRAHMERIERQHDALETFN
jgi:DNA-binding MurR/RpiR family transcriptional regulator